jgi:hypothetical protein
MEKVRKIAMVVKQMTFSDAEEADNVYWANTSDAERLNMLFDLREMMPGTRRRIKKVVYKRRLNEEN